MAAECQSLGADAIQVAYPRSARHPALSAAVFPSFWSVKSSSPQNRLTDQAMGLHTVLK
jgi:hypothetical protein